MSALLRFRSKSSRSAAHRMYSIGLAFLGMILGSRAMLADGPFQATGFKVGEVTSTSAIVWTRTTRLAQPNPIDSPMFTITYENGKKYTPNSLVKGRRGSGQISSVTYPKGKNVADIQFAAPGIEGQTRVLYRPASTTKWSMTDWRVVDAKADYTRQFALTQLKSGTRYQLKIETRSPQGMAGQTLEGRFATAFGSDTTGRVMFAVSTGQTFPDKDRKDGFQIYESILKLEPSFFVHTGDIVYYDRLAKTSELANWHWQRTYSLPTNVAFHRQVASYFIKDDHDAWTNDCWPTMKRPAMFQFTFEQGVRIFPQQVPMGKRTYRRVRWSKDLEIWLVEGRDFRSPNTMPDGPKKTIWGAEQKRWFKQTVENSDATFKILISPTPVVGPDRTNKRDNHSNKEFTHEGDEIREFISRQKNMVVICGDRHWQYFSVHPQSGVREFSCGPASNQHAGGWKQEDFRKDYHKYLNVIGGFLTGTVDRVNNDKPSLTFRFHDVKGAVKFEKVLSAIR